MDIIEQNIPKEITAPLELSRQTEKARYANFSRTANQEARLLMAGYEACAEDYKIERSQFPFWIMEFIVGGHGYYKQGRQSQPLTHGSVFIYGPEMTFSFWNDRERPFKKYFLVSGEAQLPALWEAAGFVPGRVRKLISTHSVIATFDQLLDEGPSNDAQTPQVVAALQDLLFAQITRHYKIGREGSSGSAQAYKIALELLQRDYRHLSSLADLAKRSGYSAEYLCRVFRKYHGVSPYQVLLERKMTAAWELLRDGELQISSVANDLGYEDSLHFSRVFRKVMGCAPSHVRPR
jgi:AraC-like DNA-binding protein